MFYRHVWFFFQSTLKWASIQCTLARSSELEMESASEGISFFYLSLKMLQQRKQKEKKKVLCVLTQSEAFSRPAGVDIEWNNKCVQVAKQGKSCSSFINIKLDFIVTFHQAYNIISVEHSLAFWLLSERIMLQASIQQPTGQLNLDLPNNETKIHSCVTILHRRHGKTWLISYSPNHLWCINKAPVFWHSSNQERSLQRQID